MDRHKASWILEFFLRLPIEEWLAKEILLRLPLPPLLDPRLKKTLFLRRLSSDLSAGRISHHTLHSLELLEELDRSLGAAGPHEALKAAYCAVVAELMVAPLRRAGPLAEAEFSEVFDRIWNCRVADLERSDARGLVGEGLREWRREAEDAMASGAAKERLLRGDTRQEAEAALREYLRVALEEMGPPLLERVAMAVTGNAGVGGGDRADLRAGVTVATDPSSGVSAERVTSIDGATAASDRPVAVAGMASLPSETDTEGNPPVQQQEKTYGSELAGQTAMPDQGRISEQHLLPVPELGKVEKALQPICEDLPKTVENPLPESAVRAAEILAGMAEAPANPNGSGHDQNQADIHVTEPSVEKDAQTAATVGTAVKDLQEGECAEVVRFSIMERNPTARTRQWDEDSNESLSEKTVDASQRPHLPTPRIRRVSPLKLHKDTKFVRRRKIKRWSPQEEHTLREAVKKHGAGNWKFILQSYSGTFEDRTEVDLKDKWRNMTRFHRG